MATVNPNRIKTNTAGRKYIVVVKGDTLWDIAEAFYGSGNGNKYNEIAKINNLRDPDFIVVGQTIYLTAATSGSTSSPDVTKCTVTQFGELSDDGSTELYATWTWPKTGDTENYDVEWRYKLAIWIYVDKTETRLYSTYTPPSNPLIKEVQFRVRPIPKTDKDDKGKETKRFSATWSSWQSHKIAAKPPDTPIAPNVELSDLKLNVSLDNLSDVTTVQFKLIKDHNESTAKTTTWPVKTGHVSGTFNVVAGANYKVCCRSCKDGQWSEWSPYSQVVETRPVEVTLNDPIAKAKDSIYVAWSKSNTATKYKVEFTNTEGGFVDNYTKSVDAETTNQEYTASGLTSGCVYHIRVKALNDKNEESNWSEVKTITIGTGPVQPTTWSSTTTAVSGEDESVALYWVHNTEDGSSETYAQVELTFEGVDPIASVVNDVSVEIGTINWGKSDTDGTVEYTEDGETITKHNTVCYWIDNSTKDTEKNKTHSLIINTANYSDGVKITWRVRTAGITNVQGEWSADRQIEIYNKPTVYLTVSDSTNTEVGRTYYVVDLVEDNEGVTTYVRTTNTLPETEGAPLSGIFTITGEQVRLGKDSDDNDVYFCIIERSSLGALPFNVYVGVDDINTNIQYPISYHLTVSATESYETVDNFGNPKVVSVGETLYSNHFDHPVATLEPLEIALSAQDVSLENGQTYNVKCVVAMSSGLTIEVSTDISVLWSASSYQISAEIGVDTDVCSAYLRPYCEVMGVSYRKVERIGTLYYLRDDVYDYVYGDIVTNAFTYDSGYQVYSGTTGDGVLVYYAIVETSTIITDVYLSVYRREYDGSFTEIAKDMDAANDTWVTDPHPSLDYARYRIVAKSKSSSAVTYYDLPNYPIEEKAVIIQWDEPQSSFIPSEEASEEETDGSQSLLRLPYNLDISDVREPEVSFVKYIGRKYPVSYYGTQIDEAMSINTTIAKDDVETIYALNRLSVWQGNVYIRTPNGIGYWANVKVTLPEKHREPAIQVSIDVTRVEGGV